MAGRLKDIVDRARTENLSALQGADRLADEEKASRLRTAVDRRIRDARFPELNTVDAFDFDGDRKKIRARYLALHDLGFLDKGVNPLFIGILAPESRSRPGPSPTRRRAESCSSPHRSCSTSSTAPSSTATSTRSCASTFAPSCSPSTTLPRSRWNAAQAMLAFQVISERYDYRRSTCITTNRPFKDWPKVFSDALNAQVVAERLTERAEHFVFNDKGYRTKR